MAQVFRDGKSLSQEGLPAGAALSLSVETECAAPSMEFGTGVLNAPHWPTVEPSIYLLSGPQQDWRQDPRIHVSV
eukprot:2164083-Pyramimonas_sp.AAC.1